MGTINQNTGNQYEGIFHKFRLGLQNWCRTGKEPVAFAKDSKELYLTNTLYSGGKIKQKEEKIRLRMYHRAEFPVNRSLSIAKVQCPNCGGSFDARKEKCCPYCDQPYDAGINDWIVTEISR